MITFEMTMNVTMKWPKGVMNLIHKIGNLIYWVSEPRPCFLIMQDLITLWIFHLVCNYFDLRIVSSLNNLQNSEMKFCENMKLSC